MPRLFVIVLAALLATGCATVKPQWQAGLENINRKWRTARPQTVETPARYVNLSNIRGQYQAINGALCRF